MNILISALLLIAGLLTLNTAQADQSCQSDNTVATAPSTRFELAGSVVKDRETGLMWKRCLEGMSGSLCDDGEQAQLSWPKALLHAQALNEQGGHGGYTNWRLPNIKELMSIAELQCVQPALNLEIFPSAPAQLRIWSSSPYRFYPHYSWFVDFSNMTSNHVERFQKFSVLLVRDMADAM